MICNEDYLQNGTNVESCYAHFEVSIPSKSVQLVTLTQDQSVDNKIESQNLDIGG